MLRPEVQLKWYVLVQFSFGRGAVESLASTPSLKQVMH